ncbi:MAG: hypothetical protein VYB39_01530 [Pseudomonadota bacterium]|nr:hypothetical protein [Pseudomonadota bacterium]
MRETKTNIGGKKKDRLDREARALRENLFRRKEQERAREGQKVGTSKKKPSDREGER